MIWALLAAAIAAAIAGGSKSADPFAAVLKYWKKQARRLPPATREAAKPLERRFERLVTELGDEVQRLVVEFRAVQRDYHSTHADYDVLVDEAGAALWEFQRESLDLQQDLRAAIGDAAYDQAVARLEKQMNKREASKAKQAERDAKRRAKASKRN